MSVDIYSASLLHVREYRIIIELDPSRYVHCIYIYILSTTFIGNLRTSTIVDSLHQCGQSFLASPVFFVIPIATSHTPAVVMTFELVICIIGQYLEMQSHC